MGEQGEKHPLSRGRHVLLGGALLAGGAAALTGTGADQPQESPPESAPVEQRAGIETPSASGSIATTEDRLRGNHDAASIPSTAAVHPTRRVHGLLRASLGAIAQPAPDTSATPSPMQPVSTQRPSLSRLQQPSRPATPIPIEPVAKQPVPKHTLVNPVEHTPDTPAPSLSQVSVARPDTTRQAFRSLRPIREVPELAEPVIVQPTSPRRVHMDPIAWLRQTARQVADGFTGSDETPEAIVTHQPVQTPRPIASLRLRLVAGPNPLSAAGPDDRETASPSVTAPSSEPKPTTTENTAADTSNGPAATSQPTQENTPPATNPTAETPTPSVPGVTENPPASETSDLSTIPVGTAPSPSNTELASPALQPTETTAPNPTETAPVPQPSNSPSGSAPDATSTPSPTESSQPTTDTPGEKPTDNVNVGTIPIGAPSPNADSGLTQPVTSETPAAPTPPEKEHGTETRIEGADYLGMHPGPNKEPIALYAIDGFPSSGQESVEFLPSGERSKYYISGANGRVIVSKEAAPKVIAMLKAAAKDGVKLTATSSFRTIEHQEDLCEGDKNGCAAGDTDVVASPGKSRHNFGHAIDLRIIGVTKANCVVERGVCTAPENDAMYWWLAANAHTYGYGQYAGNGSDNTGEAWHWDLTHTTPEWLIAKAQARYQKEHPDKTEASEPVQNEPGYVTIGTIPIGPAAGGAASDHESGLASPVVPVAADSGLSEVVTPGAEQPDQSEGEETDVQPETSRPYQQVTAKKVMQLFPGADEAVEKNWSFYPKYLELAGVGDREMIAYSFANMSIESAGFDLPREITRGRGKVYGIVDKETGHAYYGRGNTQLTWETNYEKVSDFINKHFRDRVHEINDGKDIDLVRNPDLLVQNAEIDAMAQAAFIAMHEEKIRASKYSRSIYLGVERENTKYDRNYAKALKWFA